MFVYSVRANTIKLVGVICVALTVLITLIAFVPTYTLQSTDADQELEYSYDKVKTEEDVVTFLAQFGWSVEKNPVEVVTVTIPAEFDKVYATYNELQKEQGLNLSKYKNKDVTRYTFKVTNYEGYEGTVYANVLVYRNRVIGGDVCSADPSGFVHGFEKN
ncbi:MAG: DUF4830 domain-containing protein [Clostridia bacterium]|nr:DUF4830 domain-containing protein [Clostridia bacterium]